MSTDKRMLRIVTYNIRSSGSRMSCFSSKTLNILLSCRDAKFLPSIQTRSNRCDTRHHKRFPRYYRAWRPDELYFDDHLDRGSSNRVRRRRRGRGKRRRIRRKAAPIAAPSVISDRVGAGCY